MNLGKSRKNQLMNRIYTTAAPKIYKKARRLYQEVTDDIYQRRVEFIKSSEIPAVMRDTYARGKNAVVPMPYGSVPVYTDVGELLNQTEPKRINVGQVLFNCTYLYDRIINTYPDFSARSLTHMEKYIDELKNHVETNPQVMFLDPETGLNHYALSGFTCSCRIATQNKIIPEPESYGRYNPFLAAEPTYLGGTIETDYLYDPDGAIEQKLKVLSEEVNRASLELAQLMLQAFRFFCRNHTLKSINKKWPTIKPLIPQGFFDEERAQKARAEQRRKEALVREELEKARGDGNAEDVLEDTLRTSILSAKLQGKL